MTASTHERLDPKDVETADRLQALIGQQLLAIRATPLGVMFEFERASYWATLNYPRWPKRPA